jgi:aspartate dehydrogenase
LSSGILADPDLFDELVRAADEGNANIVVPSGALAGFDGLRTLSRLGATEVTYRSTKPTRAWAGTPAERAFDLAAVTVKTVIFSGTAREAARLYPQNANLAASVAVGGIGFDRTMVELIADPHASRNRAELEASNSVCALRVEMQSRPESRNPKSSAIVRTSVLAALERSASRVKLG